MWPTWLLGVIGIILLALFFWLLIWDWNHPIGAEKKGALEQSAPVEPPVVAARAQEGIEAPVIEEAPPVFETDAQEMVEAPVIEEAPAVLETRTPEPMEEVFAEPTRVDDLTIIEGIGPKVNSLLQAAGITTFRKLAETDLAVMVEILNNNRLRMIDPHSWPEQARLIVAGDEAGLKALQSRLRGGREVV